MKSRKLRELLRYFLATGLSAAISLGIPILLHEHFAVEERVAVAIALTIAFVVNFITTRLFVFRSTGNAQSELLRFTGVSLGFRIGEYGLFLVLFSLGIIYYVAQLIVLVFSFVLKFYTYKRFVYGGQQSTDTIP